MPNTHLGRRQPAFRPVICSEQPQSEPGTGCGTPIVSTIGLPLGDSNTRRAAIRRIVRGATKDLRIWLDGIVSGQARPFLSQSRKSPRSLAIRSSPILMRVSYPSPEQLGPPSVRLHRNQPAKLMRQPATRRAASAMRRPGSNSRCSGPRPLAHTTPFAKVRSPAHAQELMPTDPTAWRLRSPRAEAAPSLDVSQASGCALNISGNGIPRRRAARLHRRYTRIDEMQSS